MTVRIQKPAFNIREKLSELEFGHVPYEKMPAGSVIQVKCVTRNSDLALNTSSVWTNIDSIVFTPKFSNSLLELSVDYSSGSNTGGVESYWRFLHDLNGEIERTGKFVSVSDQSQDVWTSRNNWTHFYYPNSTRTSTYTYQFFRVAGTGILYAHSYGDQATSTFTIKEIKQ